MVGLSIAHQLLERSITSDITILDKEAELGCHSSGRNSGVLHAGLYYTPGSLKSKVCVAGARRLRSWVEERRLPLNPCGKVIGRSRVPKPAASSNARKGCVIPDSIQVELDQ